ncbi:MAG: glycosyltransferase family 8 protein [Oscillospiraceae bacterium]|jgi:lipopolysaccharide biosynthesis glycosyltransferase|nr:glycosyltransferase family 8 protein [Oscillospiraceae bacterium]
MNSIPIVMAFNEKVAMYACVAMYSALRNKLPTTNYSFYILTRDKLLADTYLKFKELIAVYPYSTLHFIEVGDQFDDASSHAHWTIEMYFRLIIANVLPNLDKCIYMDIDIIVCDDLTELWSTNIGTNIIAGIRLMHARKNKHNVLDIPTVEQYVNSGFLIMNLDIIRRENLTPRFFELVTKGYTFPDQDILNIVCYDRIYFLPYKYNIQANNVFHRSAFDKNADILLCPPDEVEDALENPVIIHYVSSIKPWNMHCDYALLHHLWYQMAFESPYKLNYLDNMLKGRKDSTKHTGLYDFHYSGRKSSAYRIGRAVTYLPRMISKLIHKK